MAKAKKQTPRKLTGYVNFKARTFLHGKRNLMIASNKEAIAADDANQQKIHDEELKQKYQFQQIENFVDLCSSNGHRYPFITIETEVPKFWRGHRAFFYPFRIELTWHFMERRQVKYFKPKSEHYFVAVNSLEPMMGSDNLAWIREFPHPVRDLKSMSHKELGLIKEFSETKQFLSFRVIVPMELYDCAWFQNPSELKLRYPGLNHPDLIFEYTQRKNTNTSNIQFILTEEEVQRYSEVVQKK